MSLIDLFNPPSPPAQAKGRIVRGLADDAADEAAFRKDQERMQRIMAVNPVPSKRGKPQAATDDEIRSLVGQGLGYAEIAKRLGIHRGSARRLVIKVMRRY